MTCPHCLKYLWTPARVKQHLSYIPRGGGGNPCYNALRKAGYVAEQVDQDEEEQGGHLPLKTTRGINRRDALQAAGPMLAPRDALRERYDRTYEEEQVFASYYDTRYDVTKIDLKMVENYSQQLSNATQRWFEEVKDDSMHELEAISLLQEAWIQIWHGGDPEESVTLICLHWGREILPSISQQWFSGFAEQWAEKAFYDLMSMSPNVIDEEKLGTLRGRLHQLYRQLQERDLGHDPAHRAVRRGPQFHRGSHKKVQRIKQTFLDDDGWHEGWREPRLQGEVGEIKFP